MYNSLKDTEKETSRLLSQAQKLIEQLERDLALVNADKEKLQKANLVLQQERDYAQEGYDEIYEVVRRLDEVRFAMNR